MHKLDLNVIDCGPFDSNRVDYPDYANFVCRRVIAGSNFGLLICGSGQGVAMRANKFLNIRAALCWDKESAKLSRQHNHANVLCLGARLIALEDLKEISKTFFSTDEEGGRHLARVKKLSKPTGEII